VNLISYVEDRNLLAHCTDKRDYTEVRNLIDRERQKYSYVDESRGALFAYLIQEVKQLTRVYGCPFYSVEFAFKDLPMVFSEETEKDFSRMTSTLTGEILSRRGYYVLKVPSHIVGLISSLNSAQFRTVFTGGTVSYFANRRRSSPVAQDKIDIGIAEEDTLARFRDKLIELSKEAFKAYFGQYHIADFTRNKAGQIYSNWTEEHLISNRGSTIIALATDDLAGFLTVEHTRFTYEMVLSGVSEAYRGKRVYERMIASGLNYALKSKKLATLSTQFNNFAVQRAWNNLGFKPFYSFYTFHINNTV